MIGRLRGIVAAKNPPWLLLDVGGVGYELMAAMTTFCELPDIGGEAVLFIHYIQREDSVALYGFLNETERQLFRQLQKISGVGAKTALALLSGVSVEEFAGLIQRGDIVALTRIPGIGKKTAERMLVELRGKVAIAPGTNSASSETITPATAIIDEATTALQQLGYKPAEAAAMARAAFVEGDDTAILIRKALQAALR